MKKLLSLLGSIGMVGTAGATVVACGDKDKKQPPKENPVEVAKEKLNATIKEAKEIETTSRKSANAHEKLKSDISLAESIVNKVNVSEQELIDANTELLAAIKIFKDSEDLINIVKENLQRKLDDVKSQKDKIVKTASPQWGPIAQSSHNNFQLAVTETEELLTSDDVSVETIENQIIKLDGEIEKFEASLPQSIVSNTINNQEDVKNIVDKDWTYSSFFNMDHEADKDFNGRVVDFFSNKIKEMAKSYEYTAEETTHLSEIATEYYEKEVKLAYISFEDGKQVIKNEITSDSEFATKEATIEQIFLDNVKVEFPDADLNNPEFWKENSKLSLGISFNLDVLNSETKEFWTFTFAKEITQESKEEIEAVIREAEKEGIIFNLPSGLSKKDSTFLIALNKHLKKNVFHGKYLIKSNYFAWTNLPNDEQIEKGVENWTSSENATIVFFTPKNEEIKIRASYTINIAKPNPAMV